MSSRQTRSNSIPLTDLTGHPTPETTLARSPSAPPEYKEQDMTEPLPPYMERVRMGIRRDEPLSMVMPGKKTGYFITISCVLLVVLVVAVAAGVSVGNNKNGGR